VPLLLLASELTKEKKGKPLNFLYVRFMKLDRFLFVLP
jgi:hypothetical protein